ncbi:MAG: YgiT-type zinc finger protein [Desulfobacterales bacterium]|nr:YgiT-type zinc finger protein [Desulfobacterales bacterium]
MSSTVSQMLAKYRAGWANHGNHINHLEIKVISSFLSKRGDKMKKCPFCKHGLLEQKTVKETYTYKECSAEFEQSGEWCDTCGEGILSSADLMATEMKIKDFQARIDGLSSDENQHICKKLKMTA